MIQLRFPFLFSAFFLFTSAYTVVRAQEIEILPLEDKLIQVSYWKESSGLPTWHISDIVQDKRGLVWMGTEVGLVSLDGKSFKIHPLLGEPSVVQNIRRIIIDHQQNLWLFCATSTSDITILIYDPFQGKTISYEDYTGASIKFSNWAITTLHKADSLIWVLDHQNGIGGYFGPDHHWHEVLHAAPIKERKSYYLPAQNNLFWNLNRPEKTLDLIDSEGGILAHFTIPNSFNLLDPRMGKDGWLYLLGTETGQKEKHPKLLRCDTSKGLVPVSASEMNSSVWFNLSNNGYKLPPVWANNAGGINMVFENSGTLGVFDQNRPLYLGLDSNLKKNGIKDFEHRIFELEDGSFWMVGVSALIRVQVSDNLFTSYFKDFPVPPSTRGITILENNLYVNSYSGLFEINLENRESRLVHPHRGRGLVVQGSSLWSSLHSKGVVSIDLLHNKYRPYKLDPEGKLGEFDEVYASASGVVYVAAANSTFYKGPNETNFHELPDIRSSTFYQNKEGLWIGGDAGIWLLNQANQPIRHFTEELAIKGHLPSCINYIHEDAAGVFWLATTEGLWRWKPFSNELKTYTMESHGLCSNLLHAVYEDHQERLWIPSQNGLLCFDKKLERFSAYTATDGLPSSEFNRLSHHQDSSGKLYFGGISGVISFHPDSLQRQPDQPLNIQLISLVLKSKNDPSLSKNLTYKAVFGNDQLIIPSGVDDISIEYCVPAFLKERLQYQWRIPEIDSSWRPLSEPQFSVFHLPQGQYTLELGAFIPGNSFSQKSSFKIRLLVEPPWYLRPSSWAVVALIFGILSLIINRLRHRHLLQLSSQLSKEVADKTAQLRQERDVIASQKETLAKLDEEKTRFFQDLSHEIRNPLTLIMGPVNQILKQVDLPLGYRDQLERVQRNAQKILHLIDEVLELTKLEAGVVPVENGVAPIADFIARICQDFESLAAQKNISFHLTHTLPPTLLIQTDVRKLEKILVNLIQNALKFTASGGSIQVKAFCNTKGILHISVQDTGIGIAREFLPMIFERYYQVPSGNKLAGKGGFGIGLAMCQHYALLLGGSLKAESSPGKGTTIYLSLPCRKVNSEHPQTYQEWPESTQTGNGGKFKGRILHVDDEPAIIHFVSEILSPLYEILHATNISEAFQLLQTRAVDLVICDQVMPTGTGLELLARLRQEEGALQHIPFVFLTGNSSPEILLEAGRLRFNGLINKPVCEPELLEMVQDILKSVDSKDKV